jgi:hypothetical protein
MEMTLTLTLPDDIGKQIQYLPNPSEFVSKVVKEALKNLTDKESENATQELLNIPGFIDSFERGKKDIAAGCVVDWRTIRDDI